MLHTRVMTNLNLRPMKHALSLLVPLVAALVAGCGGGGGGNGSSAVQVPTAVRSLPASAGSDVNEAGFVATGSAVVRSLLSGFGGTAFEQTLSAGRAAAPAAAVDLRRPASLARWALAQAPRPGAATGRESAQAVAQETRSCVTAAGGAGSFTVIANDADNNQLLSRGDTISITFSACAFASGDPLANGDVTIGVNAIELDANEAPTALDLALTFEAFSIEGQGSLSGGARLWAVSTGSGEHSLLRYTNLRATIGVDVTTLNIDLDQHLAGSIVSTAVNGAVTLSGQAYKLVQATPFTSTVTGRPETGTLGVSDAAGDRLDLTARGSVVDFDFTPFGSAAPTAFQHGLPWSSFDAP